MCTVTYIPTTEDKGFILTSNRDEQTIRKKALPPRMHQIHGKNLYFPKDGEANGTWICFSDTGYTLCLLNGAGIGEAPFRHSRGLILIDFFKFDNTADFLNKYSFEKLAPFKLIIIDHKDDIYVNELHWNGINIKNKTHKSSRSNIWSSDSLYSSDVVALREKWFAKWLSNQQITHTKEILDFHTTTGEGNNESDLIMKKGNFLQTLSVTSIRHNIDNTCIFYKDLLSEKESHVRIFK